MFSGPRGLGETLTGRERRVSVSVKDGAREGNLSGRRAPRLSPWPEGSAGVGPKGGNSLREMSKELAANGTMNVNHLKVVRKGEPSKSSFKFHE